jgi:hypothetical protein
VGTTESETRVGREIIAGLAVGALEISVAASFAFLIFAPLSGSIPRVVGPIIVGAGLISALIAPFTKVKGLIGGLQDAPAVVIAAVVAALVAEVDPAQAEATAMTFIVVVGVLMGIVLMLAGRFRITTSACSLPFTVVSGFLAGTGWLLARAGIEVMVDQGLEWGSVIDLFGWDLLKWRHDVRVRARRVSVLRLDPEGDRPDQPARRIWRASVSGAGLLSGPWARRLGRVRTAIDSTPHVRRRRGDDLERPDGRVCWGASTRRRP